MNRIFSALILGLSLIATHLQADICAPPPASFKTNDFGLGETNIATIWDATNACPNTRFFRQYSLDNGTNWLYPSLLGSTTGAIDPECVCFVQFRKLFFFLPADSQFITRAIPYDEFVPPTAELTASSVGYTLLFPDGGQSVVLPISSSLATQFLPDKPRPKKHARPNHK